MCFIKSTLVRLVHSKQAVREQVLVLDDHLARLSMISSVQGREMKFKANFESGYHVIFFCAESKRFQHWFQLAPPQRGRETLPRV